MTRFEDSDELGLIMRGDWQFVAPDLLTDESPETSVLLSLFTDALAADDDVLPDTQASDRRGWWATTNAPEGEMGSKLWLLSREKQTEDVRARAEQYCRTALQWMLDDDVCDLLTVEATWNPLTRGRLDIEIGIYRAAQLIWTKAFPYAWQAVQRGEV